MKQLMAISHPPRRRDSTQPLSRVVGELELLTQLNSTAQCLARLANNAWSVHSSVASQCYWRHWVVAHTHRSWHLSWVATAAYSVS